MKPIDRGTWLALTAMGIAVFVIANDFSAINVAIPQTDHITDPNAKQAAEEMYDELAITAEDIAEIIAFAVGRPRRMTLNEVLVRPTAQAR